MLKKIFDFVKKVSLSIWRYVKTNWILVSVWAFMFLVFLASILIITLGKTADIVPPEKEREMQLEQTKTEREDVQIEQEQGFFPNQIMAPFIDMVSWVDTSSKYSVNGVPSLGQIQKETGLNYYNLGFVRASDSQPLDGDGNIRWCWGGYYNLSEAGNDGFQYEGIKKTIKAVRDNGGDIIVSVGGQLGKSPWLLTNDVNKLKKMYIEIIKAYDLKRIDLDIEETNQGAAVNQVNAKAIKKAQDETGIEVVLTIPIMPYGWTNTQTTLVRTYMDAGVDIKIINCMTMCFGYEVYDYEDFGDASIRALKNAKDQLIAIYKDYGITLSDAEAYAKLGSTVDIGYENSYNPVFTTSMTKKVVDFANEVNLGMFSYWSLNRDALMQPNIGVKNAYEFFVESAKFPR